MKERKPSETKAIIAQNKVRDIHGRFFSSGLKDEPVKTEKRPYKKKKKEEILSIDELSIDNRIIPDDIRDAIGTDSLKFYEYGMLHARTWHEKARYAKELKPLQYASYASIQKKDDEVTEKVIRWEWEPEQEGANSNDE